MLLVIMLLPITISMTLFTPLYTLFPNLSLSERVGLTGGGEVNNHGGDLYYSCRLKGNALV